MPQVRVDPLSGLKTIIAGARADRPNSGFNATPEPPVDPATDPFLPGHEDQTPPTLHTDGDPWRVRVFDCSCRAASGAGAPASSLRASARLSGGSVELSPPDALVRPMTTTAIKATEPRRMSHLRIRKKRVADEPGFATSLLQ